ncbi:hypothetical protein BAY60_33915 [Prauserella muralis]|uniref:Uncharacterized protein n=1 Tax=Prauserella muralis TaxID=588067 RepID=A0A2V4AE96_9PSEU|nr:hypothetical protein BAY60_33915 [Prauserella muralis]
MRGCRSECFKYCSKEGSFSADYVWLKTEQRCCFVGVDCSVSEVSLHEPVQQKRDRGISLVVQSAE